jgi:hypothetical protein
VNKAQLKAKAIRRDKRVVNDLQMQGARYALRVYREAMEITLGLGAKRLARVDDKFMELIRRDETIRDMKERGEI